MQNSKDWLLLQRFTLIYLFIAASVEYSTVAALSAQQAYAQIVSPQPKHKSTQIHNYLKWPPLFIYTAHPKQPFGWKIRQFCNPELIWTLPRTKTMEYVKAIAIAKWKESKSSPLELRFVCLGNICRSPAAEAIFNAYVEKRGLSKWYTVDSCGTGGGYADWYKHKRYHIGNLADSRMRETALQRGITITSRSRDLLSDDIKKSDLIFGMDMHNMDSIVEASEYWNVAKIASTKAFKLSQFCKQQRVSYIPDPYMEDIEVYDHVLDLLEDAIANLLDVLEECNPHD